MSQNPRLGVERGRNLILRVGRGVARPLGVERGKILVLGVGAHALGSDEAETSSSELDEAWPGP